MTFSPATTSSTRRRLCHRQLTHASASRKHVFKARSDVRHCELCRLPVRVLFTLPVSPAGHPACARSTFPRNPTHTSLASICSRGGRSPTWRATDVTLLRLCVSPRLKLSGRDMPRSSSARPVTAGPAGPAGHRPLRPRRQPRLHVASQRRLPRRASTLRPPLLPKTSRPDVRPWSSRRLRPRAAPRAAARRQPPRQPHAPLPRAATRTQRPTRSLSSSCAATRSSRPRAPNPRAAGSHSSASRAERAAAAIHGASACPAVSGG